MFVMVCSVLEFLEVLNGIFWEWSGEFDLEFEFEKCGMEVVELFSHSEFGKSGFEVVGFQSLEFVAREKSFRDDFVFVAFRKKVYMSFSSSNFLKSFPMTVGHPAPGVNLNKIKRQEKKGDSYQSQ